MSINPAIMSFRWECRFGNYFSNMPAEYELQVSRPELHRALLAAGARPDEHLIEFTGQLT